MIKLIPELRDRLKIFFPYNPVNIAKIRAINGSYWHPDKKYWSIPHSKNNLDEIAIIFANEKIYIDPALQPKISPPETPVSKPLNGQTENVQQVKTDDKNELPVIEHARNLIRLKHYSIRTEQSYLGWIMRYLSFHKNKQPDELLGHKDVSTTMIYTHVLNKPGVSVKSPLDGMRF